MIDFVGTSLSMRKELWIAMATMHFHIALTVFYYVNFFSHSGGSREQCAPIQNCPWGAR